MISNSIHFLFLIKKWVVDVLLYSPPIGLGTIIK